jgi:hypothetical protein
MHTKLTLSEWQNRTGLALPPGVDFSRFGFPCGGDEAAPEVCTRLLVVTLDDEDFVDRHEEYVQDHSYAPADVAYVRVSRIPRATVQWTGHTWSLLGGEGEWVFYARA